MEILVFAVVLGFIPAMVAKNRGRDFFPWWLYGSLLFVVALPHALLIKPQIADVERQQLAQGLRKCSFCAEMIKPDAKVCRFCGRDLPTSEPEQAAAESEPPAPARPSVVVDAAWDDPSDARAERERLEKLRKRLDEFRKQQSGR